MSSQKEQFSFSFLIPLMQCHEHPALKLMNFHIFNHPFPFESDIFSNSSNLAARFKINQEIDHTERHSGKTHTCI